MLLTIFILNLVRCSFANASTDAKSSPKQELGGLENLVEKLEMRMKYGEERQAKEKKELEAKIRDLETRLETKDKEIETRLMEKLTYEMKKKKDESEKREKGLEPSNTSNNALTNPSLRDLPIVIISAWQPNTITSPQTVTFDSFLANYNNAARPGGGDGVLDLDSGVFTCFTPGYYQVSFSAHAVVGPGHGPQHLFLYKNWGRLPESSWYLWGNPNILSDDTGVTSSRIEVSNLLEILA